MNGWLTTALILFPIAGGLVVWLLPLRPFAVGSTALLFALVEVGLWIDSVARFDFGRPRAPVRAQRQSWFSDLGVSYHVGFYGFSLWLVGLTVVVMAAAIAYAFWAGPRAAARLLRPDAVPDRRDRRRLHRPGPAPLLRLLGGDADPALRPDRRLGRAGADRRDDQVRHLHDGRLAADARLDHRLRPLAGARSTSSTRARAGATGSSSASSPRSRSRRRSSRSTAGCRTPTASRRPRWRRPLGRRLEGGGLRLPADRDREVPGAGARLPHADPRARGDRARLRVAARVPRARPPRA